MRTTILFSAVDEVADRYSDYIAEVRAFLLQSGMPVGVPEAATLLAERLLRDPSFGEDLLSMLRVVCVGEQEVSYLQLLGLLLVSAQGRQAAASSSGNPAADITARKIFNFLVDRRRSMKVDAAPSLPESLQGFGLPEEAVANEASTGGIAPAPPSSAAVNREKPNAVLARALALSADEQIFGSPNVLQETEVGEASLAPTIPPEEVPLFASAGGPVVEASRAPRYLTWAVGLCGIVLGVLLGLLFQRRSSPGKPSKAAASLQDPAPPSASPQIADSTSVMPLPARRKPRPEAYREASSAPDRAAMPRYEAYRDSSPARSNAFVPSSRTQPKPAGQPGARPYAAPASAPNLLPNPADVREVGLTTPPDTVYAASARSSRSGRVSVGSAGIMAANLVSSPAPFYPAQASTAQVQGEVVIEAIVGRDGDVIETRVISGPPLLRQAAESAVQRWRYRPYEVDGSPAEIATTARLEFKLDAQ